MTIKKGDKVKVEYTGTLEDGTVFDSSTHGEHTHPLEFEAGAGQLIKGFDDAVIGMKKGEEKEIKLSPEQAYGEAKPDMIKKFSKDKLPPGQEAKPGMMIMLNSPDGRKFPAKIVEVDDKEVSIDFNHPLAGKALNFKIKVVEITSS